MYQNLVKKICVGADVLPALLTNQNLNGLLITTTVKPTVNDKIQVILKSPNQLPKVLINSIPLLHLAEIWDMKRGFSVDLQADQQAEAAGTTWAFYCFGIDLGSINLIDTDSKLEISLTVSQAQTISLATFLERKDVDRPKQYTLSTVLTDGANDVDALWLCSSTTWAADTFTRVVSVNMTVNGAQVICELCDIIGASAALGSVEAMSPLQTASMYSNTDGIPDKVDWNVTGSGSTGLTVITEATILDLYRVSITQKASVSNMINRIEKMDPEKYSILKRMGAFPDVNMLKKDILPKMNVPKTGEK